MIAGSRSEERREGCSSVSTPEDHEAHSADWLQGDGRCARYRLSLRTSLSEYPCNGIPFVHACGCGSESESGERGVEGEKRDPDDADEEEEAGLHGGLELDAYDADAGEVGLNVAVGEIEMGELNVGDEGEVVFGLFWLEAEEPANAGLAWLRKWRRMLEFTLNARPQEG